MAEELHNSIKKTYLKTVQMDESTTDKEYLKHLTSAWGKVHGAQDGSIMLSLMEVSISDLALEVELFQRFKKGKISSDQYLKEMTKRGFLKSYTEKEGKK